jgi:DNA-binding LacI/PurR family transcriptional regulator
MNGKRITIYHIAAQLGMSASYVSRALNNHPAVSQKIKDIVKKKASELNYRHNSHAANLRQGSSKTIGVIVPQINQSFFSDAIAGIEEACFENNHSLIICQSHETYKQECLAIETLIHQNVDCILISISAETGSSSWLEEITNHNINLVQFDRCLDNVDGYKILNDNKEASFKAVNILIKEGYKRIAFLGGPTHLAVFSNRKEGYIEAVKKAGLNIPENYIIDNALSKELAIKAASELLSLKEPPDAFFNVSDHQSLGVLQVANSLSIKVPEQIGIFGFANEAFTELIRPTLSSIDQKSKELGKCAANLYFKNILSGNVATETSKKEIIKSEIIERESSRRHGNR